MKNTSSEYSSTSHDQTSTDSSIISGGDTTIAARVAGDRDGMGDLNIIGSAVDAGGDVLLATNDDINLQFADETSCCLMPNHVRIIVIPSAERGCSIS